MPPNVTDPPPVSLWNVPGTSDIVHATPSAAPLIVAGDGEGLVDLASIGALDGGNIILYSGILRRHPGETEVADRARRLGARRHRLQSQARPSLGCDQGHRGRDRARRRDRADEGRGRRAARPLPRCGHRVADRGGEPGRGGEHQPVTGTRSRTGRRIAARAPSTATPRPRGSSAPTTPSRVSDCASTSTRRSPRIT